MAGLIALLTLPTLILSLVSSTWARATPFLELPPSSPFNYSGIPSGGYDTRWQSYFQVTETLPNVTFSTGGNSYAGNIGVNRNGHPDNSLFFWGFEKTTGSMTATGSSEPWGIWLNGGPGSSSMVGLHFENGPLHIGPDWSVSSYPYSWHKIADYFWLDQPVGTGYSTADADGFAQDETDVANDFWGFVSNLVQVFPGLATRPLYLTGESFAGTYISYITKSYFSMSNPPVKIGKLVIGDGLLGNAQIFEFMGVVSMIETYPQMIGYDPAVYQYFNEQSSLCGFNLPLEYPGNGPLPALNYTSPAKQKKEAEAADEASTHHKGRDARELAERISTRYHTEGYAFKKRGLVGRSLEGRPNGTIDPFYGCNIIQELEDYAVNYTYPWTTGPNTFDIFNVVDALEPLAPMDASIFLNDPDVVKAIHAPQDKTWVRDFANPFGIAGTNDPSPEPISFLTELATNMSNANIPMVMYSGNNDAIVPHRATALTIQNTTFGGIQGFSQAPSTPWTDSNGNYAGIIHQERNWTLALFLDAGHFVPYFQPAAAYTFAEQFIFGSNQTGLLANPKVQNNVVGGVHTELQDFIVPGTNGIYYGHGATMGTFYAPAPTVQAWNKFIATAASGVVPTVTTVPGSGSAHGKNGALGGRAGWLDCAMVVVVCVGYLSI